MSSPVKDLPKIASDLKGELLKERSLKPTEAQEKNVLPSADDVKQEKTHQNIMTGWNELYEWRHHLCFHSKQPLVPGIAGFNSESLKPTETVEKVVLPGSEEIKTERTIQGVLNGVKGFDGESLKTVKTREPASPMQVVQVGLFRQVVVFRINDLLIQTEKAREGALSAVGDFDKTKLKKSETDVKNPLPSSEAIAQELEHIKFKVMFQKFLLFVKTKFEGPTTESRRYQSSPPKI